MAPRRSEATKQQQGNGVQLARSSQSPAVLALTKFTVAVASPLVSLTLAILRFEFMLLSKVLLFVLTITGLRLPLWNLFTHILEHHRSIMVTCVVLPMSFVFDLFWRARTWYISNVLSAPELHKERVKYVQKQVLEWNEKGRKTLMCTARPGFLTVSPRHARFKNSMHRVEVNLTDILSLDTEREILHVEPLVNMLQLYDYLLPRGYTLPVFPELDELTVGGLINGYGIETGSHCFGLFQDICESFEVILANGERRVVTKEDELFHAIPWSFGTVAFLVSAELRVMKTKKYVRHVTIPTFTTEECVEVWTKHQKMDPQPDILEGTLYDVNNAAICVGWFTDGDEPEDRGVPVNNWDRWWKEYFYMHCKGTLTTKQRLTELIPLRQYYQRHNRSIFWALQDQIPICNNWLFRLLLGWLLPPRVPLLKLIETDAVTKWYEEKYVLQDWLVPLDNMLETINLCEKELSVYPTWLCGHRLYHTGKYQGKVRAPPGTNKEGDWAHYVDVATIGQPRAKGFDSPVSIAAVEDHLRKIGGYQGNYSYTYQSEEQYRVMYDHTLYDKVRRETGADKAFPQSHFKIARKNAWAAKAPSTDKKTN